MNQQNEHFNNPVHEEQQLEDALIELILNHFSQETKVPIGLFDNLGHHFSAASKDCFSGFCRNMQSDPRLKELCDSDHASRAEHAHEKSVQSCHAGLFNMEYPIVIEGERVATLLCGQRKLKGKEHLSESALKEYLDKQEIHGDQRKTLLNAFRSVDVEDESVFQGLLFDNLAQIAKLVYQLKKYRFLRERQDKQRTRGVNNLVHEILLPMQAIASNVENIKVELETGELNLSQGELREAANAALVQVNILGLLAENVQKSLLGAKEPPYVFSRRGLYRILKDCIELFELPARKKGIILRKPEKLMHDFPDLDMSFPDLSRAFRNIYHNAVKYSYAGTNESERWISTEVETAGLGLFKVSVSSYGVGIEPDEIEAVFREGVRGRLSTDRHRTGAGLGLSEVKKIVEKHNGQAFLTSEPLNVAYKTTVTVILPFRQ